MREDIERALKRFDAFYGEDTSDDNAILIDIDALAESKDVIVIEAEVEHRIIGMITRLKETSISYNGQIFYREIGHRGIPGPCLFFGVPKPKENRKP